MGIFSWLGSLFRGKRKKKKQPDVDYLQPHPGSFESERKEVAENRKLSDPKVISMDPTCDDSKINGEGTNNSESQIVSSGSSNRKDEKKISFEGKTSVTNDSTAEEGSSSNSEDVQTRVYNLRLYLIDELRKMGIDDKALVHASDEILLEKIRESVNKMRQKISQKGEEINNLKSKKEEYEKKLESEKSVNLSLREKQSSGQNEKDTLNTKIASLRKVVDSNEKTIGEKNNLIKEQNKNIEQLQKELDNLNKSKIDLENKLAQKSKLEEEIASTNTGQLSSKTADSTAEINQPEPEIEALKKEDLEKATEIQDTKVDVNDNDESVKELIEKISQSEEKLSQSVKENEDLKTRLDNAEKEINARTNEKEELSAKLKDTDTKLKNTEGELAGAKEKLRKTEEKLKKTEEDLKKTEEDLKNTEIKRNASLSEIETLSREKKNLESAKAKLSEEKNVEIEEKNKLTATLKNDISSLLANYKNAADSLMKSLDSIFIKECNEDEETDTVESMCQKICSDAEYVASEIDALKEKEFNSTADLEKAYKEIIADNIESLSFTEIARWWAYSRLPFVLDTSREGGRTVELSVIEDAYAAVERLLALAGFRYHLPILFVQNLTEGEFENLTGSEQLNLSYQVPNVTSHVGKIDREDCENVILDIVKLGYYEGNQLVKKTSVIVQ